MIFDGDDTLWSTEPLYDSALAEMAALIGSMGVPPDEWLKLQRKIDLLNVQVLGVSSVRFPVSSVQALVEIARKYGIGIPQSVATSVSEIAESVFWTEAQVDTAAQSVLSDLAPYFSLVLLTKGDAAVQHRRLQQSGLESKFDFVWVVDEKDETHFGSLAAKFQSPRDQAWSIGNSAASDINPALRAGMNAIWIDAHVWQHERREEVVENQLLVVLHSLSEVPDALLPTSRETKMAL